MERTKWPKQMRDKLEALYDYLLPQYAQAAPRLPGRSTRMANGITRGRLWRRYPDAVLAVR